MHLVCKSQIIWHLQVNNDLVQHRVFIASGGQRRHQAGLHQTVNHVVLSLRDPGARGLQRPHILRVVALVHRLVHLHAHVFALPRGQLERVAPEVRLGLQSHLFAFGALGLFHINGHRQPDARLHVHPPTIEVEV